MTLIAAAPVPPADVTSHDRTTTVPSPVGPLHLRATSDGVLSGVFFEAGSHPPDRSGWRRDPAPFRAIAQQLQEYFAGERQVFDVPMHAAGTPFQRAVWAELQAIPYGSTVSYSQLAARIGRPAAVRAVGLANGRNPLAIVIPCHRVIGADGAMTGYGGGMPAKRWLLQHEGALPPTLL